MGAKIQHFCPSGDPQGFSLDLWRYVERDLNLTSNLVRATSFGLLDPDNDIWTGLVGMVQRGEADVSLSAMSTTYSRFLFKKELFLYKKQGKFI